MRVQASVEPEPDTAKGVPVHAPIVIPPRTILRPQGADLPGIRIFAASPIPGAMRFPEVDPPPPGVFVIVRGGSLGSRSETEAVI